MTIVEGVLKGFSAGEAISSQGTGWVVSEGVLGTRITETGRDWQRGFIQRDFVEIGDKRVRNVVLSTEYDAMLEEAVGEVVAVGFGATSLRSGNRHTVVSNVDAQGRHGADAVLQGLLRA